MYSARWKYPLIHPESVDTSPEDESGICSCVCYTVLTTEIFAKGFVLSNKWGVFCVPNYFVSFV